MFEIFVTVDKHQRFKSFIRSDGFSHRPWPTPRYVKLTKKVWERSQKSSHFETASNSF